MKELVEKRIEKLRKALARKKLDTMLVLIAENRRYLSGFTGEDTQFDESAGALLITADRLILATDSRYELQARRQAPAFKTVCYPEGLSKELPRLLKQLGSCRVGFEDVRVSVSQYRKMEKELAAAKIRIEWIAAQDLIEAQRIRKVRTEVRAIKNALAIAESVFENVLPMIRPGMTEMKAAWLIEKEMRENGAEGLSFPVIVAAGANSALPHAIPGNRKFKSGEPILFDWGTRLNGYCSDISRTIIIGKPDATFSKIYRTVRDAQRMAIAALKPGMSTKAVDAIARGHIEKKGFKGRFGHGLGHGVGLAIHEHPRLSPLSDHKIKTGMVLTVEPGIYIPGWGGVRIENMVVVRRKGAEVLNRLDTGLIKIKA